MLAVLVAVLTTLGASAESPNLVANPSFADPPAPGHKVSPARGKPTPHHTTMVIVTDADQSLLAVCARTRLKGWALCMACAPPSCHNRCRRLPPAGDTAVRGRSCLVALALSATHITNFVLR